MIDIAARMNEWSREKEKQPLYAVTVLEIEGSAVRGQGASMGIAADRSLTGSVSGGCIESTVIDTVESLRSGASSRMISFCPTDDPLMEAVSPCGGTVRVFMYPYSRVVGAALLSCRQAERVCAWGLIVEGPDHLKGLSFALGLEGELVLSEPAEETAAEERPAKNGPKADLNTVELVSELEKAPEKGTLMKIGNLQVFLQKLSPAPHAVVVGGSHIGEALTGILKSLNWKVTIVDPRADFAPADRFRAADAVYHQWPEEAFSKLGLIGPGERSRPTAVAAISHNEQIDDAGIAAGLEGECFFLGVLGSRRTFGARIERLKERGYHEQQLERVHGPIGLNIGAETPEEIALAIAAQMVQDYRRIKKTRQ